MPGITVCGCGMAHWVDKKCPRCRRIEKEATEKDAKRYRWLRSGMANMEQVRGILNDTPHGIDAAVDAAMKLKPNKE